MIITIVHLFYYATIFFISAILLQVPFTLIKQKISGHPPGPLALPVVGHLHLLSPLIHHSFHHLSIRYGPLIRLRLGSVPCIIASTPELAKEFLKIHDATFSSRMQSTASKLLTYQNSAMAFSPHGPYWKFVKKMCRYQLLGARPLDHFRPIITNEIRCFLQLLMNKAKANEIVNVTQELSKLTNNIICQIMLSIRCTETEDDAHEAKGIVREITRIFGEFNVSDFIYFFRNIDLQGIQRRAEEIHKRYDALLERIITDRERKRSDKQERDNDFLDMLLDVSEDKESEVEFTRDHIKALILVN